jgi:methionine-S-sulfoxide reductase
MTSEIYFAGGCFWGIQAAFARIPGVISTECGYANGDPLLEPDYLLVCSGKYGYRETVRVEYDPEQVPLDLLLWAFFFLIDPTQERRQGNDVGIQYQTGIYWTDAGTAGVVQDFVAKEAGRHREFHTETGPLTFYHRAEEYHQRYLEKNPMGYCHIPLAKMVILGQLTELGPAELMELKAQL